MIYQLYYGEWKLCDTLQRRVSCSKIVQIELNAGIRQLNHVLLQIIVVVRQSRLCKLDTDLYLIYLSSNYSFFDLLLRPYA